MKKILLFLILPILLLANVSVNAPKTFLSGEPVSFSISASGSSVDFPDIKNISGYVVQTAGTSSQISIINGTRTQKLVRNYRFHPTSNVTIPSFEIKVDGKVEKTKEQKVVLQKVSKTKSDNFDLTIKINKNKVYVGEEILLTMTFKYKKNIQIYDLNFIQPNFDNFWSKQLKTNKQPQDNLYVVQELSYLLFPQKSGTLEIPALSINAVLPDLTQRSSFFGAPTKNKRIYSNSLKVDVKPLPNNVNLIGDFKISSKIDKDSIKVGEAVSFQLEIEGRGNIDDLDEFKLNIPNATIYDNPSQKDFNIQNGKYGGVYKKSYSIVASDDFTIPSISLEYFDKKLDLTKSIKSKEYKIKVHGVPKVKQQLEVKQPDITNEIVQTKVINKVVKTSDNEKILYFIFGFIVSSILFISYLVWNNRTIKQEDLPLEKSIKSCATKDELLKKLVPYINIDENLDKMLYELESNKEIDLKKIKKDLVSIVRELKL